MSDDKFDSIKSRNLRHEIGGSQRSLTDDELRDKLASEFEEAAEPTGHICHDMYSFKAGWDAARANPPFDEAYDINRCIELADERDQISKEYSTLKNEYFKLMGELTKEINDYKDQLQWSLKKEQQLKEQLFEVMSDNKPNLVETPKEFYITKLIRGPEGDCFECGHGPEGIHVIEYFAYSQLRAEVETLRHGYKYIDNGFLILKERDQLRAEVKRLKANEIEDAKTHYAIIAERNQLRTELESYKDQLKWSLKNEEQYKQAFAEQCERANQLHAEVERLKIARVGMRCSMCGEQYFDLTGARLYEERDRLKRQVEVMKEALERANYQGDYYDQKPHKAMEVVYGNREALAEVEKLEKK